MSKGNTMTKELIKQLRKNCRQSINKMSLETSVPVTTLFRWINELEGKSVIKKHISLVDFSKIGYPIWNVVALKVAKKDRENLKDYLSSYGNVNSLHEIDSGYDFIVETLHESYRDFKLFMEVIDDSFAIEQKHVFTITNELKKEVFLG